MSETSDENVDAHLSELDDGCGCVEVWTHTSEKRVEDEADDEVEADETAAE